MFSKAHRSINIQIIVLIIFLFMLSSVIPVQAQAISQLVESPGVLDTSFDSDGLVTTTVGVYGDEGRAVAIQPDGKILVAGYSGMSRNGGNNRDFTLIRYNTNGSLDTTFDVDGKTTTDFGNHHDYARAVALQSDGKIVVAGFSDFDGSESELALARYNSNGSLDTTFDVDGKVTTNLGTGYDFLGAMAIQPDGKIVAVGSKNNGVNNDDAAVIRYNTNGSLDTTFDTDGVVITAITTGGDTGMSIVLQPDGKIIVGGTAPNPTRNNSDLALIRYNGNGSLDTSFDFDGIVRLDFGIGLGFERGGHVALQPDGKIILAGSNIDGYFLLARYNSTGSLDTTFGNNGLVGTYTAGADDAVQDIALQSNGKIILAGYTRMGSGPINYSFAVARYNNNGSLDSSFDSDGKVITDFGSNQDDLANSVTIQSDGKIIVVGYRYVGGDYDGSYQFAVARYVGDAASLIVTKTADTNDGVCNSDCSLREAIVSASPDTTINFASSLAGQTITLASTLLINKNLIIDGSALSSKVNISGNGLVKIFFISSSVTATLNNLFIMNGSSADDGGGVYNAGTLMLTNSTISSNVAGNDGGGIYNKGTLTITNTTISNNSATRFGGGIENDNSNLSLTNVTLKSNSANSGGGIDNFRSDSNLTNVTFTGNSASSSGGGMSIGISNPSLTNVTFDSNTANYGGGIYNEDSSPNLANATFAYNSATSGGAIYNTSSSPSIKSVTFNSNRVTYQGGAVMNSYGSNSTIINSILYGNLEEVHNESSTATITYSVVQGGYVGTGNLDADPLLGPLQANGGFTKTMALGIGSPAINAGDNTNCPATDQRGVSRPQGSHCDIGAYELNYLTISGNAGIGGAVIRYGYGLFTTAGDTGDYSIKVLPGWSGTVIPTKLGYTFTSSKKDYTNIQTDQANQNYTAAANTYNYSGNSGDTWRVSLPNGGGQSDEDSYDPSISADGRYLAYWSFAQNLVAGNGATDIVVYDNQTGQTSAASVHSDGTPFESNSYAPSISADGRYVAFASFEWYGAQAIWVHDRHTRLTTALPFDGPPSASARPSISGDGQYIAYMDDGILTDGDTNNKYDIFVYDQWSASLERVSISSSGTQANGDSVLPAIAGDGRFVAFQSSATNLVTSDTNGVDDIFVHDNQTGETKRVSINSSGMQANAGSFLPSISSDGRYVAFHSAATNLVSNDTNGKDDVFVHDIQTGATVRVSVDSNSIQGNQASDQAHISPNGRYVAFRSLATNLAPGDTNGAADIYMYDRQTGKTRQMSITSNGAQANGDSPSSYSANLSISGDGKFLAFSSDATNLVNNDTNEHSDIFVHETTKLYVGAGMYDDPNPVWIYTGNWGAVSIEGAYNNTDHYSNDPNATASISFTGSGFSFKYLKYPTRGNIEVWLDGGKVDTINAYSSTLVWQAAYTRSGLSAGPHTVAFKNGGPSGSYIDVDSIQVIAPDLLPPGDVTGLVATAGTINGSINLSWTAPADDAGNNASGPVAAYLVKYATSPFTSWNDGTLMTTGLPIPTAPGTTQTMTVSGLNPGTLYYFAMRAQDEQTNLSANYATASATAKIPIPVGIGSYDDADPAWTYTGNWIAYNGTGPYNNTLQHTNVQNASAAITFTGTQFTVYFTKYSNRGAVDVWIDGVKQYTFSENGSSLAWQQSWTLPTPLSNGMHTVQFKNPNVSTATYIDLDAITIMGPPQPVGPGMYDDSNAAWNYTGSWTPYAGSGPYNNTLHYINVQNASAAMTFTGTQFTVYFTKYPNRGDVDVWIDGVKQYTFSENSSSLAWQQSWTLPTPLSNGTHTVQFKNPSSNTSVYIDIDAIQILGPVAPGTYDDANPVWSYVGTWTSYSNSGPYNNTLHYTNVQNASSGITFTGTQFMVYFTKYPNRGDVDVWIDGVKKYTFSENGSSLAWQQTWTLPTPLSNGIHTVQFKNPNADTAIYIDLDGIQIAP